MTKNRFIAITAAAVFASAGATTAFLTSTSPEVKVETHTITKTVQVPTLPVCEYEDSDNCIWDAKVEGNGEGDSFIAWHGEVYYLDSSN